MHNNSLLNIKQEHYIAVLSVAKLLETGKWEQRQTWTLATLTYTFAVFEESKCSVPRIKMDSNDGPLTKPGGEVHLVSFMMQQALKRNTTQQ